MAREVTRIIMGVLFLGWLMVTIFYGLYVACAFNGQTPLRNLPRPQGKRTLPLRRIPHPLLGT